MVSELLSLFLCMLLIGLYKKNKKKNRRHPNVTQPFFDLYVFPAGGEWRIKYNRAIREMDFTKKKLQQEFDDKLETEQQSKRHLERRARNIL